MREPSIRPLETVIYERKACRDVVGEGLGVVERSNPKAKAEIQELAAAIRVVMGLDRRPQVTPLDPVVIAAFGAAAAATHAPGEQATEAAAPRPPTAGSVARILLIRYPESDLPESRRPSPHLKNAASTPQPCALRALTSAPGAPTRLIAREAAVWGWTLSCYVQGQIHAMMWPMSPPLSRPYTRGWYGAVLWITVPTVIGGVVTQIALTAAFSDCARNDTAAEFEACNRSFKLAEVRVRETLFAAGRSINADVNWFIPLMVTMILFAYGLLFVEQIGFRGDERSRWLRDISVILGIAATNVIVGATWIVIRAWIESPAESGLDVPIGLVAIALFSCALASFLYRFHVGNVRWRRDRMRNEIKRAEQQLKIMKKHKNDVLYEAIAFAMILALVAIYYIFNESARTLFGVTVTGILFLGAPALMAREFKRTIDWSSKKPFTDARAYSVLFVALIVLLALALLVMGAIYSIRGDERTLPALWSLAPGPIFFLWLALGWCGYLFQRRTVVYQSLLCIVFPFGYFIAFLSRISTEFQLRSLRKEEAHISAWIAASEGAD